MADFFSTWEGPISTTELMDASTELPEVETVPFWLSTERLEAETDPIPVEKEPQWSRKDLSEVALCRGGMIALSNVVTH